MVSENEADISVPMHVEIQFANEIEYIHPERVVEGSTLFREAFKYYFADFFSSDILL